MFVSVGKNVKQAQKINAVYARMPPYNAFG